MSIKIDRKAAMRASLSSEKKSVDERFARADAILAERPSGLAASSRINEEYTFSAETSGEQAKSIISVRLDWIHENPLNARHIYDPDVVKELAASIATRGQLVPAPAVPHPTLAGQYLLIDGLYRKKAITAAGLQTMDLVVRQNEGDIELYRMSWLLNEERSSQSSIDNAFAWRKLLDRKLLENENQIAELLGISASTVNKTLALLKLPSVALDKMVDHPTKFGVFTGYELTLVAKRAGEGTLLELIDHIISEDLSSREVGAIRAKLEAGETRKRKETSRQYKINDNGRQIGSLKEWDSGKISLEVVLKDPKERTALVAELRTRFGLAD